MESRKITIRFMPRDWAWADRKRREAMKDFGGTAKCRYSPPKEPGGYHHYYVTEIIDNRTNVCYNECRKVVSVGCKNVISPLI